MDNSNSEDNEQYGIIIVGPEGDFDDEEMQTLMDTWRRFRWVTCVYEQKPRRYRASPVAQMIINV